MDKCKDCKWWRTTQNPANYYGAIWLGTCEKRYQMKRSDASCDEFIRRGTDGGTEATPAVINEIAKETK